MIHACCFVTQQVLKIYLILLLLMFFLQLLHPQICVQWNGQLIMWHAGSCKCQFLFQSSSSNAYSTQAKGIQQGSSFIDSFCKFSECSCHCLSKCLYAYHVQDDFSLGDLSTTKLQRILRVSKSSCCFFYGYGYQLFTTCPLAVAFNCALQWTESIVAFILWQCWKL